MRRPARPVRAATRRPVRVASGALAVTLAATVLYAQPGTGEASAAGFRAGPSASAAEPSALTAAASADYFLKIDGIPGESADKVHKGTIEIASWSLGASNPTSVGSVGGGAGTGKVSFSDLSVTASTSKASPRLMLAVATGERIRSAVLYGRKAGGQQQDYLTITLTDVLVSSFQSSASGDVPTDSISLNFSKIEYLYRPQEADGRLGPAVRAGWDLKAAKKV